MIGIVSFLTRIAVFIVVLYLIYLFYKSLGKPTEKRVAKKATCPSPKVFIDYTEGRIKGKKKKAIDGHIAHCKNCQDAVKDVFNMPKEEARK